MHNSKHYPEKYSIAVRTVDGLFQRFLIRRSKSGNVYFNFLGSKPEYNPHISYHQSGASHNKFFDQKIWQKSKQQLSVNFRGTENVAYTHINSKDALAINMLCDYSKFTDVMEIPESLVNIEFGQQLSVDLIEPDTEPWPSTYPYAKIIQQQIFRQNIPWIAVSLFKMSLEVIK